MGDIFKQALDEVIAAGDKLAAAIEKAGEDRRYWPRDMRLDGTAKLVEAALDEWAAVAHPDRGRR